MEPSGQATDVNGQKRAAEDLTDPVHKRSKPGDEESQKMEQDTGAGEHAAAGAAAAMPPGDGGPAAAAAATPQLPNDVARTRLAAAASADQGCRPAMEDVHVVSLDARLGPSKASSSARVSFFGIWDGHGGADCAEFASQHLHANVMQAGLAQVKGLTAAPGQASSKADVKAAKQAIAEGFRITDEALLRECAAKGWQDGACAVCCWVVGELCLVANVGDAKAVLARVSDKDGSKGQLRAVTLTREHLALHAAERARIERASGFVSGDGRLNGRMQVSRSFGDAALKKAGCSSMPDIQAFELTDRDHFLVLGCDGFWGVWDGQGCVDATAALLADGTRDEKGVTNRLINVTVRERGAKDNCSVLLVRFVRDRGAS